MPSRGTIWPYEKGDIVLCHGKYAIVACYTPSRKSMAFDIYSDPERTQWIDRIVLYTYRKHVAAVRFAAQ